LTTKGMLSSENHTFMLFMLISLQMLTDKLGQQMVLLYITFFPFILDDQFTTLSLQKRNIFSSDIYITTPHSVFLHVSIHK